VARRITTTTRSTVMCKKLGWHYAIVEKRIPKINITKDVWGFGDILVLDGKPGSMLLQTTSRGHVMDHFQKMKKYCRMEIRRWLTAGNRVELWGWSKRGPRGKRKRWTLDRFNIVAVSTRLQRTIRMEAL
jgi:hypothetical protein